MRRGTTPTLTFTTPFAAADVADGYITFKQGNDVVLEKRVTDDGVSFEGKTIMLKLSQAESLLFDPTCMALIQLRFKLEDGNAVASNVLKAYIRPVLKDGVI